MSKRYPKLIFRVLRRLFLLVKDAIVSYDRDHVIQLGAAMSYYTIFSLPAIIIITISLVGMIFGAEAVQGEIFTQMRGLLGEPAAIQIQDVIVQISDAQSNWWATVIGFIVLIFGATGVFTALQNALNIIFGVKSIIKTGFLRVLTNRIMAFGMVLAIAFIILASLILNTIFLSFAKFMTNNQVLREYMPYWVDVFQGSGLFIWKSVLSFLAFNLFFAMIYRVLPDVKLQWKHIWGGAFLTSILFGIGEFLLGLYLANTNLWTAYGAAGSVVVILIWVYYSAQMVFIGAEFIKVYCKYRGHEIRPKEYAIMNTWKGIRMRRKRKMLARKQESITAKKEKKKPKDQEE